MTTLSLEQFVDKLRINEYYFEPSENSQSTRSIGGIVYKASRGPKIWIGEITCSASSYADYAEQAGLLDQLRTVGTFFVFSPPRKSRPAAYKAGDDLNNVAVNGTQAVGYSLRLKGLPQSFTLTSGDCLSFQMGGVHRMYRITSTVQASVGGLATVSIHTPLNPGGLPAADLKVELVKPKVTCVYADGSFSGARTNLSHSDGFSFGFTQVFRV